MNKAETIGIIGAGVAGLHLGLLLLARGRRAVIYTDATPEQQRAGRLMSVPTYFGRTRERERELGVAHWDEPDFGTFGVHVAVPGPQPLGFFGNLSTPALCIDQRLTLPRLLEDFERRGGEVVLGALDPEKLVRIADRHALVVVCTGRGGLASMFPTVKEWSPFAAPQRLICSGIFRGVAYPDPLGISLTLTPHGELFYGPMRAAEGHVAHISFEAIPGGELEFLAKLRRDDDPAAFDAAVLEALRVHAPAIHARMDPQEFGLRGPLDLIQGGVTPVVRRGYRQLTRDTFAVAIGDAHMVSDPISGQGANLASSEAFQLGEAICGGGPFDEAFCRRVEADTWALAEPVMRWTNLMLGPPAPQLVQLLAAASRNQAVADTFANNFDAPERQWRLLASLESTGAFLGGLGHAARAEGARA